MPRLSSNAVKLSGIKPRSDGPPSCFNRAKETQIPSLRQYVHHTTAENRRPATVSLVEKTNDLLERVKLIAAGSKSIPSERTSRRLMMILHNEISGLEQPIKKNCK